ncbi:hypothetical protein AWZ03_013074 [Drosophila navojoa]|uniref:Uncharacterized protein n=1 Tax=Drosophila navojoa TaxID=7232 RepID=A0A484AXC1_DRONA|nr:hypothetical protein AWZ03_013074 [Drosophila navojoa]
MPSTIDHLQQLTGSQLDVLCYNYNVVERQPVERRHLERRLHVAIIAERAKWRARHLMYNFNDDHRSYFGNLWSQDDRLRDVHNRMLFSRYRGARLPSRHSGGDEQEELKHRASSIEDGDELEYDENNLEDDEDERMANEDDDDEQQQQEQQEYEQYQQFEYERQQMYNRRNHPTEQQQQRELEQQLELEQEQDQQQEQYEYQTHGESTRKPNLTYGYQIPLFFQQQFQHHIHSQPDGQPQLHLLRPQGRTSNIAVERKPSVSSSSAEYYSDSSTSQVTATEYLTLASSNVENILDPKTHVSETDLASETRHQLHVAERFINRGEPRTSSWTNMEQEGEVSSERVLCTINFMNMDYAKTEERHKHKADAVMKDLNGNGDRRLCDPQSARHRRRSFWRFILAMLATTSREVASHKLQYSVIGCSIIIFTYIGIKMVQ